MSNNELPRTDLTFAVETDRQLGRLVAAFVLAALKRLTTPHLGEMSTHMRHSRLGPLSER